MATTLAAIMAIVQDPTQANANIITAVDGIGRRGFKAWDLAPPPAPLTAAQRTTVLANLVAGTVATLADVTALIASAASPPSVSQAQVWQVILQGGTVYPTNPPGVLSTTVTLG